ncbi:MAG TPA: hypothetical protein VI997_10465 [Candidatus Thermoplasmatota archaeon]|nr:hypothetical protein [Candidatus Thermoplasmatota archaeon]
MTMPLAVPIALTVLFGSGFLVNEWSHGALSEAMGLGHHHMTVIDRCHEDTATGGSGSAMPMDDPAAYAGARHAHCTEGGA